MGVFLSKCIKGAGEKQNLLASQSSEPEGERQPTTRVQRVRRWIDERLMIQKEGYYIPRPLLHHSIKISMIALNGLAIALIVHDAFENYDAIPGVDKFYNGSDASSFFKLLNEGGFVDNLAGMHRFILMAINTLQERGAGYYFIAIIQSLINSTYHYQTARTRTSSAKIQRKLSLTQADELGTGGSKPPTKRNYVSRLFRGPYGEIQWPRLSLGLWSWMPIALLSLRPNIDERFRLIPESSWDSPNHSCPAGEGQTAFVDCITRYLATAAHEGSSGILTLVTSRGFRTYAIMCAGTLVHDWLTSPWATRVRIVEVVRDRGAVTPAHPIESESSESPLNDGEGQQKTSGEESGSADRVERERQASDPAQQTNKPLGTLRNLVFRDSHNPILVIQDVLKYHDLICKGVDDIARISVSDSRICNDLNDLIQQRRFPPNPTAEDFVIAWQSVWQNTFPTESFQNDEYIEEEIKKIATDLLKAGCIFNKTPAPGART